MNERNKSAVITLVIGLVLNISLGVAKLVAGILSDSMSVASDAFNNLSDACVSVVTIVAVWLAAKAADHDHPYGHGRYEYIATFVLGAVIVAVGVEVLIGGIKRAITPVDVDFDTIVWATLGAAVGVKAFMAVFYFIREKKAHSDTIKAAAVDSMSDSVVTSAVLICAVIEKTTGAHIDGYASIAVALFILVFAVRILKETISRLLGERPDERLVKNVQDMINRAPHVISSHDLLINDYGEAVKIAEVDVVFPADMTFLEVHKICDDLEHEVYEKLQVRLTIHADPFITDDDRLTDLCARLEEALASFGATAHDVQIDDDAQMVRLDILLSDRKKQPVDEINKLVEAEVRAAIGYDSKIGFDYI